MTRHYTPPPNSILYLPNNEIQARRIESEQYSLDALLQERHQEDRLYDLETLEREMDSTGHAQRVRQHLRERALADQALSGAVRPLHSQGLSQGEE